MTCLILIVILSLDLYRGSDGKEIVKDLAISASDITPILSIISIDTFQYANISPSSFAASHTDFLAVMKQTDLRYPIVEI